MIGVIDRVVGPFNIQSLRTRVLSRENSYVFLGRAKRNNEVHAKMMKSMKGEDEEEQLICWGKEATGEMVVSACFVFVLFELKMDVKV